MKAKIASILVFLMLFTIPSTAFAKPDDYGYNENARIFVGTFENWENFIYGLPASPADTDAKDVLFLVRKWDKGFDDYVFKGLPPVDGAWQQAHFYRYLPGDQLGWTWNWNMKIVYSSRPIEDAVALSAMEMGIEGFYLIQDKTWLTDPDGNETIVSEFHAIPPSLGKGFYEK